MLGTLTLELSKTEVLSEKISDDKQYYIELYKGEELIRKTNPRKGFSIAEDEGEETKEKQQKKESFETKIFDMANSVIIKLYEDGEEIGTAKRFLYQLCSNSSEETFEIDNIVNISVSIDYKNAVNSSSKGGAKRPGPCCLYIEPGKKNPYEKEPVPEVPIEKPVVKPDPVPVPIDDVKKKPEPAVQPPLPIEYIIGGAVAVVVLAFILKAIMG